MHRVQLTLRYSRRDMTTAQTVMISTNAKLRAKTKSNPEKTKL